MIKPKKLKKGDTIAIISPSAGVPFLFPKIYENGLKTLENLGFKIKEFKTARENISVLKNDPKIRAEDVNAAFADPDVKGIITSIGGNDSVRILKYLDPVLIKNNPKLFMGYSDTTSLHLYMNRLGLVTFYGPSIMAGFSQHHSLPEKYQQDVEKFLFQDFDEYQYQTYYQYSDGYPEWSVEANLGKVKPPKNDVGWRWLQGNSIVEGELTGGCLEVLEMNKGTKYWPEHDYWKGKILLLETSESVPPLSVIDHVLRNYGVMEVFEQISALIYARPRGYSDEDKINLDKLIIDIVKNEFVQDKLPIISNFDFGHTDPQFILPLGVKARVDCQNKTVKLIESPFSK